MKRKLPEKESSYKKLDLGEIQETKNLWNSWTKYSLIGLLIATLSKKPHFIDLFDFRVVASLISRDSHNSRSNKNIVLNTLIFFVLPISVYRLSGRSIVEQKNFGLTKIREQTRHGKDYLSICKKYFRNLDTKSESSLHNDLPPEREKKLCKNFFPYSHDSSISRRINYQAEIRDSNLQWYKFLKVIIHNYKISRGLLPDIEILLGEKGRTEVYDRSARSGTNNYSDRNGILYDILSASCDKLLSGGGSLSKPRLGPNSVEIFSNPPYFSSRKLMDRDSLWWEEEFFQNSRNYGESEEFIIKSPSFLRKRGNMYPLNYIKFYSCQLFRDHFRNLKSRSRVLTEKTRKSLPNVLDDLELFVIVEDILSDSIYQLFKRVSYREEADQTKKNNSLGIGVGSGTDYVTSDYAYITEEKGKIGSMDSFSFSESSNPNKFGSEWIRKNDSYVKNRPSIESILIHSTLPDSTFFQKNEETVPDFFGRFLVNCVGRFSMSNLLSQYNRIGTHKFSGSIRYVFLELLPINRFGRNMDVASDKYFDRISRVEKTHYSENFVESDDTGTINLWEVREYYSNSSNRSFPFNFACSMIERNNCMNERPYIFGEDWNPLLLRITNLFSPIFYGSERLKIFISCVKLSELSAGKNNELDTLTNEYNELDYQGIFFPSRSYDNSAAGESISDSSFVGIGAIRYNSEFIVDLLRAKFSDLLDSVLNNCDKYLSKSWNHSCSGKNLSFGSKNNYTQKNLIHRYSMAWKTIMRRSYIRNAGNTTRIESTLQVYKWVGRFNNSEIFYFSKEFASHNFFATINSSRLLRTFFKNSKYIDKLVNPSQNYARSSDPRSDSLFDRTQKSINRNSIVNHYYLNEGDMDNLTAWPFVNGTKNEYSMELFDKSIFYGDILSDSVKNNKLLPIFNYKTYLLDYADHPVNPQSNYNNKRFFFHSVRGDSSNTMYPHFLTNFWRDCQSHFTISETEFSPLRREIVSVPESQLFNALLSGKVREIFGRTHFSFFTDFLFEKCWENSYLSNILASNVTRPRKRTNNIETIFYHRSIQKKEDSPVVKFNSEKFVKNMGMTIHQLDDTEIGAYHDTLRSESLMRSERKNDKIFQSIIRIFLYLKSEYFRTKYETKTEIHGGTDKFQCNQFRNFQLFGRYISFRDYTSWFFTFEWWEYYIHVLVETFQEIFVIISYRFEYFVDGNTRVMQKNFEKMRRRNHHNLNSIWNLRIFVNYDEETIPNPTWSDSELINNWNSSRWAAIALVVLPSLSCRNFFSILIGSDSMDSWKRFETIKYLADTSRASYFTKSMPGVDARSNKTKNIVIHLFLNLTRHIKNIQFHLLIKKKLEGWLISNKSLDLSRRKRNLLAQSLIAHTQIKKYGFQLYPQQKLLDDEFGYRVTHQQGLLYFRHLSEILKKDLTNYPLHLADKWIFFASLQKIIFPRASWQSKKFNPRFQKVLVPIQFGLSCSKGILLIGSVETGRSYPIKNLAADSYAPLSRISINKLLYNKPDVVTESWMNILIESLRRLNLILDLARKMSPCIIWIQNIHQLNVDHSTQNVESDPTFLLGILLKHFRTNSTESRTRKSITMIGSTHVPERVDPALISPNRLDRIINIRSFNNFQRRNQFTILLNSKNFRLGKNPLHFQEFGFRTMGYNIRDLAALANEVSSISVTRSESFVYTDTMRLAFHRQILGLTHVNNKPQFQRIFGILLYRIGRAVIQNVLVKGSATNPLNTSNYSWKRKFYYLSKWYLESPINESIMRESMILTHALACLAGIAARDSWFLSEKKSDTLIPLDKLIENDFDLASSILESLSKEFSWLETCQTRFVNCGGGLMLTTNFLSNMQNGISAMAGKGITRIRNNSQHQSSISRRGFLNEKSYESRNLVWSPRFWRLSFLRSHLFDWIKRPNNFGFFKSEFTSPNNSEKLSDSNQFIDKKKEQLPYERILPRVRKRNVQELEYQFEQIMLEEQSEILGFSRSSTQYCIEYQLYNKPKLFIGKRILWDPVGLFLQIRHFVFSRRDFFVDEEMLRRLYVTYGARRERERSRPSHKIKQFFLRRGYDKDSISKLSVRWWNQLSMGNEQSINTLKRIEQIGIQLKRPQILTPVYSYQRWLIENQPEKFLRFELLLHRQRRLEVTNSSLSDSFTYTTLLESYQYLLKFFLSNRILLNRVAKILLEKGWIFQDEIENLIHSTKDS